MYNPSLREQPREQLAETLPLQKEASLLKWLESQGRLLERESQEEQLLEDEEEITELMGVEDSDYEEDEDIEEVEE